jgi:hypothetical protein
MIVRAFGALVWRRTDGQSNLPMISSAGERRMLTLCYRYSLLEISVYLNSLYRSSSFCLTNLVLFKYQESSARLVDKVSIRVNACDRDCRMTCWKCLIGRRHKATNDPSGRTSNTVNITNPRRLLYVLAGDGNAASKCVEVVSKRIQSVRRKE